MHLFHLGTEFENSVVLKMGLLHSPMAISTALLWKRRPTKSCIRAENKWKSDGAKSLVRLTHLGTEFNTNITG
jgi:hypothetical protein